MDERDRRRPLADAPIAFERRNHRRPDQARPSAFRMGGAAGRRRDPERRQFDLARTGTAALRSAPSGAARGRLPTKPGAHPKRMTDAHRFDRYEVSLATRQLLVDGRPAPLGGRTFDLLLVLVEHRDRVLCKDELLHLVWPGLVVEENNLQVHVSKLRKVLGMGAIATVPGFGYRFALDPNPARAGVAQPQRTRGNLPAPLTSFVGRDGDLRDVRSKLGTSRLLTLTGPGGIGKSRLAGEVARLAEGEFADGAWVVDMAPLADGRLIAEAAAAALDVPRDAANSALDAIARHASLRKLVLVLDNCEHVLPDCAQLVRRLLEADGGVRLIATSREPLHVAGEVVRTVPALETPHGHDDDCVQALHGLSSVALFVDRAAAARPGFTLTNANARAVARICRDLDGIPLALELAAARVRALSVDSIAEHLTDRFRFLAGNDATALPRHQTLRAAIGWSFDLLSAAECALLRRLAVFAGDFSVDGEEAVAASTETASVDVVDLLGRLVEKSVVAFDARGARYHLLKTVRQYALERLAESGDESAARGAHARYCERVASAACVAIVGNDRS